MIDKTPLYNSRILKNWIEYLKSYYPNIDIASLLKYAKIETFQLDDEGHWLTQDQVNSFHEMLEEKTNNPAIAREVGRFSVSSRASGALGQYLLGFINPATAYAVAEKINASLSRAAVLKTKAIGADKIEVKTILKPNVVEKHYQCLYRLGALEALAKLFTKKFANIEHPVCMHKGGDYCLYTITWEKTRTFVWKQLRNYSFIFSLVVCILSLFFLRPVHWDILILICVLIVMGTTLYAEHMEKKELLVNVYNQGNAAERLLDQINKRYNEALLIQEIGEATSMIPDVDKLIRFIMESLEKRLNFDRGMIMLTNEKKDRLIHQVSYGYNPKDEDYLNDIEFHLDNPHARGVAVVAFREQTPLLVNDVSEIEKNLSPKSLDFVRAMRTQSFICVPIVYKGESMGILIVDNVQSKRSLSQTDLNLLMGIAPQIGISINNAISYQKIRESEARFRSLSENAPDIIYTLGIHGEVTYVNPAIEKILGYQPEEVHGKYFIDITRKDNMQTFIRIFEQVRDQKQTIREEMGILLHKNGTERYFSISGAPNFDSAGNVVGLVGTFKDLTDVRKSEMELKRSFQKLQSAMSSTIDAISIIVETRDPSTAGHQRRVADLARAIATEMNLPSDQIEGIRVAAVIHDIGKISVPAEILSKPSGLTDLQFGIIKTHSQSGHDILKNIDFPWPIARMVLEHHERMDGSGYPKGLVAEETLLESRIMSVADVVEAMASHRPYRPSLGIEAALEEIEKNKGILYDNTVAVACLRLFREKGFQLQGARF